MEDDDFETILNEEEDDGFEADESPKSPKREETAEMKRIGEEYKRYWRDQFGYPESMPEFAKRQRKKYLEQKWTDAEKLKTLQDLRTKNLVKKTEKLPSIVRKNLLFACDNLSTKDALQLDPSFIIRLKVKSRNTNKILNKCYDVNVLYHAANSGNKDKRGSEIWVDPEEGTSYSQEQIKRIKRIYDRVAPDKPSSVRYQQELEMQREEQKNLSPVSPRRRISKKKEKILFGCENMSDEEAWRQRHSNKLVTIVESGRRYCYDLIEYVENHVLVNDGLWTNPATGKLIPSHQQKDFWIRYQNLV